MSTVQYARKTKGERFTQPSLTDPSCYESLSDTIKRITQTGIVTQYRELQYSHPDDEDVDIMYQQDIDIVDLWQMQKELENKIKRVNEQQKEIDRTLDENTSLGDSHIGKSFDNLEEETQIVNENEVK